MITSGIYVKYKQYDKQIKKITTVQYLKRNIIANILIIILCKENMVWHQ